MDITKGRGLMETNVNQKIYRSAFTASMFSVSFAIPLLCCLCLLCGFANQSMAQTQKKITPDPYYSTMRQSAEQQPKAAAAPESSSGSFYQPAWKPPKTATESTPARQAKIEKANTAAEVWASVARKTTKPVTRIDFSRLDTDPPKTADVSLPQMTPQPLKPVGAGAMTKTVPQPKPQALTPIKVASAPKPLNTQPVKSAKDLIQSAVTKSRSIIRQRNAEKQNAEKLFAQNAVAATTPAANVAPPEKARPLKPWKNPADFNMPKIGKKLNPALSAVSQASATDENTNDLSKGAMGVASKIAAVDGDGSFVQQAAYQPQLGQRLKAMVEKGVSTDRAAPAGSNLRVAKPQATTRVADASTKFYTPGTIEPPQGQIYSQPIESGGVVQEQVIGEQIVSEQIVGEQIIENQGPYYSEQSYQPQDYSTGSYQGESFENSRVLALVGGHPVFVGDMMFEVNQIFEKHMKGAPQAAKDAQKGKLMERLLPKYIDQKILFVSTLDQLPEEANIEDILKQAEKTFNEQALPDLMENSGVESITKFDAILRSQGTSVRQMRRAWAKDQISKYFLQEKVKFNRQVTHLEMLDEYRSNFDQYEVKGKVRWEQIEIQPAKAGGRLAAKDKIEDIYDRLVHGGNFEAIAKKESHGFRAFKGGQYDWTSRGSLVNKEIDKSIFTLPIGKLSGVIETKAGFHVIRVIERVETHHTPFTEAQVEIKKRLLEARRDDAFRTYIDGLKDEIKVEYVNE